MIELASMALIVGVVAAAGSAVSALFAIRGARQVAQTSSIEIRFPDGRKHLIASGISGDELKRELATVQREISDAVVEDSTGPSG